MSINDDYKRHRGRYQRWLKDPFQGGGLYAACPICGREGVRIEFHHYGRQAFNDQAIPACRDCHDKFRNYEEFEHPRLGLNPRHPLERIGRLRLGHADLLEAIASEVRDGGEVLIALARKYPDLEL